jgi:aspartyl-tRNA(Asn)/glutamyl-tRNA(Gln) amidotransferase subunit A
MSNSELAFLPVWKAARLLAQKKLSPVELIETALARIDSLNPKLNAYLTVVADQARAEAKHAEREMRSGRYRGLLHGIPISLKDNIWTHGVRTTAGSKILRDFVPDEDATVVRRLRRAGAIVLGKTNLHEFAYGVTTVNPHYGPTRNPWNTARIAGGSSGGSAAALASGMCAGSVGTDTGGSVRIPAALCGVVGLKATFGRVSSHGTVPLAPSFDHVGPIARTVADVAILLGVIAGRDSLDPTTAQEPVPDFLKGLRSARSKKHRLRLGWPRDYFFERVENEIHEAVKAAARLFEKLGATIEEVALPHVADVVDPSTHIALAEARAVHEQAGYFPAHAAEYAEETRKRLEMGGDVRAVDYLKALEFRKVVRADFEAAFARVDAILAPTTPLAAPRIEDTMISVAGEPEHVRAALLRPNRPSNFTGLPAISVPCGFTAEGLPVGLQLIGRAFEETRLLQIAHLYEQAAGWHTTRPTELGDAPR